MPTQGKVIDSLLAALSDEQYWDDHGEFFVCRSLESFMEPTGEVNDDLMRAMFERGDHPPYQLAVWDERNLLIDGHRRHRISKEFGVQLPVHRMHFGDELEMLEWVVNHQESGRNLSAGGVSDAVDRRMFIKQRATKFGSRQDAAKAAAKEKGISVAGYYRKRKQAEAYEGLVSPIVEAIEDGGVKIGRKYLPMIADLDEDEQLKVLGEVYNDRDYLKKRFSRNSASRRRIREAVREGKEEADRKLEEASQDIPLPEGVATVEEPPVIAAPKHKAGNNEVSNHRLRQFMKAAEKAYGQYAKASDSLFFDCLPQDAATSEWKRRSDRLHRQMNQIFTEIAEAYDR